MTTLNYKQAIKYPFKFVPLTIGSIFFMIPLVNLITQLFSLGYLLNAVTESPKTLPDWNQWWLKLGEGLIASIIALIYAIPTALVTALFGGAVFLKSLDALTIADVTSLTLAVAKITTIGVIVVILLGLFTTYLLPAALLRYIKKGNFTSAFQLKSVFKTAFTGEWLIAWISALFFIFIIGLAGGFLAGFIGGFLENLLSGTLAKFFGFAIPFIIIGYTTFISLAIALNLFSQAHKIHEK